MDNKVLLFNTRYLTFFTVLFSICLFTIPSQAFSAETQQRELTIASSNNFPPINLLDSSGNLDGFGRDLSDAVTQALGVRAKHIHSSTWTEVLQWLDTGEADLIHDTGFTQERTGYLDFTTPILEMPEVIFVRENNHFINNLDSLNGRTVACVRNHISHIYLQSFPDIICKIVETPLQGLYALVAGEVDALVYPQMIIEYLSQTLRLSDQFKIVGTPLRNLHWSMTVKKGNLDLLERLNEGIARVRQSGEYDKIYQKWYGKQLLARYSTTEIVIGALLLALIAILTGAITVMQLTNRKIQEAREAQKENETKYRDLIENIPDIIYRTDIEGEISFIAGRVKEISGYTEKEALGMKVAEQIYSNPDDRALLLAELQQHGQITNFEAKLTRKDGSFWWGSTNARMLIDDEGIVQGVEGIVRDISERKMAEDKLNYQATHDMLTNLINRPEFERRSNRLLSTLSPDSENHAMCFLDLDQFKIINDTCGHSAGDELLRQISVVLKAAVRRRDTLARLGGDEFGVLMEHCSISQAQRACNNILNNLHDFQFLWDGQVFRIGASIGLVAITPDTLDFTELMKRADAACYMAKDLGRHRTHLYHPEDTKLVERKGEMQWVTRIHQALEDNRFCLYAQPIVPLNKDSHIDKGDHYEILLRMLGKDGKVIPPGAFLPAAERYSLIETLDSWVIKHLFEFFKSNPEVVKNTNMVSINLSGPSLTNESFLEFINTQLDRSGVDPGKICFEITETVAISNLAAANSFISILKQIGCHFALDDFGSGLSSFAYLKNLPVDFLKIDGMFVKDIVEDPIDHAMVKSINEIAQVMKIQTIAEFVEDDEIRMMLQAIGVDYAQGYGIGKPFPIDYLVNQKAISN
ncbi:MAG: EAL domain-containing protein [Gammaproteobacteria bacterium]|nr:EAL domain-containing protein [Gammaproteobacteria bacterium]